MVNRYRVVGLRRAGSHALIIWIAHHFEKDQVVFLNDIDPSKKIFSSTNLRKYNRKLNKLTDHEPFMSVELNRPPENYKCLMYSYEERDLTELPTIKDPTIIVMRDPYNMTASRIKKIEISKKRMRPWFQIDEVYKYRVQQYLRECVEKTKIIENKIVINFNRWVSSEQYRKSISVKLGLSFIDKGSNKVMSHGGGSSFDGIVEDANNLQVLDRWKPYINHPLFKMILEDKEITDLSKQLFGGIVE